MAQMNLTLDSEILKGLFTSEGRDKAFSELVSMILNQVLSAQASEQAGAEPYERSEERKAYRNGCRERKMNTRIGELQLKIPRLRNGEFSTELFARYQRSEQALVLSMMEMVVNGVSTRKVSTITEEMCGSSFSKSTVSALCSALDPAVSAFRSRPLDRHYPFVMADAIYMKVREEGAVRSKGLMTAVGVNEKGIREVLGFCCADSETEAGWTSFFQELKDRGLSEVDLVISDNHKGLVKAITRCFQGAGWQRCQTHFSRNVLDACPKKLQGEVKAALRSLYEASNYETAVLLRDGILAWLSRSAPKAAIILEEGFEDILAVLRLAPCLRRRLRTTNGLERLNEELRRRERVIRIFPNEGSLYRLMGALLIEIHETWQAGRIYLEISSHQENTEQNQDLAC
jgi:putative transposase